MVGSLTGFLAVSYEELSSGAKELKKGILNIRRNVETELDHIQRTQSAKDLYISRMNTFVSIAEERVDDCLASVKAAGHFFNSVKAYYGEGDERFDPANRDVEVFSRPTSLEFFGTFKTFVTSWDLCKMQNKARRDAKAINEKHKIKIERKQATALSPQSTGASSMQTGALEDLHARLLRQGTPRAKRERRQRDIPRTPDLDTFDFSAFSLDGFGDDTTGDQLAEAARNMLGQMGESVPTGLGLITTSNTTRASKSRTSLLSRASMSSSAADTAQAMLDSLQLADSPPNGVEEVPADEQIAGADAPGGESEIGGAAEEEGPSHGDAPNGKAAIEQEQD